MKQSQAWAIGILTIAAPVGAQVTSRASQGSGGVQGNGVSLSPSVSADGRFVAFASAASNLVAGDTNGSSDAFVHDRELGTTERVSLDDAGVQGNRASFYPLVSADGRFVAFISEASNLVAGDSNGFQDVFVRDRHLGTTERVSLSTGGGEAAAACIGTSISADGRYVAFYSEAWNLVADDTNRTYDVFVRDRRSGRTERVSVGTGGTQGDSYSHSATLSADGAFVAFESIASNLVAGDTNGVDDVFVRDLRGGTTERVSVGARSAESNGQSGMPWISGDGRLVAFGSSADNLVASDTNGVLDVFVRDRLSGQTVRVSVSTGGVEGNDRSFVSSISADGRCVAFHSFADDLVTGDTNGLVDVFVRDVHHGTTDRVSVASAGTQGDEASEFACLSANGRFVAFGSWATNLVGDDTNSAGDVFVHDREYAPLESVCHPGTAGVISCPCANPPGGPGRGCDNSSGTGGAMLSASGVAFLSQDTLVFTTSGEMPAALSVVLQGSASHPNGATYGQGVHCVSGATSRLYTKIASSGGIAAPDFGAGDAPVSVRSATLGDTILAAESRWYVVGYRDPVVLGGCPSTSTFNATQTGRVSWSP